MNRKIIILLCVSCFLYSCSNKFIYNNLDWVVEWYLSDYVQLTAKQDRLVKKHLHALHDWHRQEELAKYRLQLVQLSADLNNQAVSSEQLLGHMQLIYSHGYRMRAKISEELSTIAPSLTAKQVKYLFQQLEDDNQQRLDEFNEQSIAAYNKKRREQIEDSLDEYLGSVTDMQKFFVKHFVKKSHVLTISYVEFSRAYLKSLENTFKISDPQNLSAALNQQLIHPQVFIKPEFEQQLTDNRQLRLNLIHNISETLTPQQTDHFQHKINDLIKLIDALIPKPPQDADSELRPTARTRRNMLRMVIPFSSVATQC